jgi:hypothetical protein
MLQLCIQQLKLNIGSETCIEEVKEALENYLKKIEHSNVVMDTSIYSLYYKTALQFHKVNESIKTNKSTRES